MGLPAQSLAWGLWKPSGQGLTGRLSAADLSRLAREGIGALTTAQGLALLDAALQAPQAYLLAVKLERTRLQRLYEQTSPPAVLRGLVRPALKRASTVASQGELKDRLAHTPEPERKGVLLSLVQEEIAVGLNLAGASAVEPDRPLKKLGLDSLMAVELRNRLAEHAGVSLPATLAFDYPTPNAVAGLLLDKLDIRSEGPVTTAAGKPEADAIASWLLKADAEQLHSHGVLALLRTLHDKLQPVLDPARDPSPQSEVGTDQLETRDGLFEFLENRFGGEE